MPRKNILSEDAVEAHTEILLPDNYRERKRCEGLLGRISKSISDTITQVILEGTNRGGIDELIGMSELFESFNSYEGILDDTRLDMVNLWMQARSKNNIPTVPVCDKLVPAVFPYHSLLLHRYLTNYIDDRFYNFHIAYERWNERIREEEDIVEMETPENAVESMEGRLLEHVKARLSHYYNIRVNLEAIGIPYSSTKLQVKFCSPTLGARVMYTTNYCNIQQSTK